MQIYIFDPDTVETIKDAGYEVSAFSDINGVAIWEFSYTGEDLDIGALMEANKILIKDSPKVVYL